MSRWDVGAEVAWRSRPGGAVGYVFAAYVVADSEDVQVLFQPSGAPCRRRAGRRGGPGGRQLVPGTWTGGHEDAIFEGPPMARAHPCGTGFSVLREWCADRQRFRGWYVNLERPWRRTPVGFDSHDDILDIVVADDLSGWRWKDEDELAWAVENGVLAREHADSARDAGYAVAALLTARRWPFDDAAWSRWRPDPVWRLPRLPTGWDRPFD